VTIEKGKLWETTTPPSAPTISAESQEELHTITQLLLRTNEKIVLSLSGPSDLKRTIGALEPTSDQITVYFPIDGARIELDEKKVFLTAHAKLQSRFGRDSMFVMNAQWLGDANLGPRAHPNDGKLDVISWENLSLWERRKIRARFPTGSFLPHPSVTSMRMSNFSTEFKKARSVQIDGVDYGHTHHFSFEVIPDAFYLLTSA
jgi:hypothetical protein